MAALTRFAGSEFADRNGLRPIAERLLHRAASEAVRTGKSAGRAFAPLGELRKRSKLKPREGKPSDAFDLTPTEDQQMMRDVLRRFARESVRPAAHDADMHPERGAEVLEAAGELGLTVDVIPESLGGTAEHREILSSVLMAEDLAWGDMGLALAALSGRGFAAALTDFGTVDQQNRYLAAMAEEDAPVAALAIDEQGPRSNPSHPQTRATKVDGGYRLVGTKVMVPMATSADLFLVTASVDGEGPTAFVVPGGRAGLTRTAARTMGLASAQLGTLEFDGVMLDGSTRVSPEYDHARLLDLAKLGVCALAVGTAQSVVDYVIEYCNEREAFGEPISHKQAVAFMIADMATEVDGMRLTTWRAAARAERGLDFHREVKLAHILCSDHGMKVGSNGVQLLGGHGFVRDHPVERWYRQLRAVSILSGGLVA
ncbi:MAG: acyl-CoA dehydrogenase family protein [Myxococcota bacterium]